MDFTGAIPSNLSYTNHLKPLYKKKNGKVSSSGFLEFKEENGKYVIRFRLFDFKNKKVSKLFDAIDNLGLEYFQFTDKDEEEFLSDNIKEENSSSIIYDIVEEMRKNRTINLVN